MDVQFMVTVDLSPDAMLKLPTPDLRGAEFEGARGLNVDGLIQQISVYSDGSGGCMIIEALSGDAVLATVGTLPMVLADVLQAPTTVPLAPIRALRLERATPRIRIRVLMPTTT